MYSDVNFWIAFAKFAGVVFGLPLAVCWALVPFAIFGIKPRLDLLTAEVRELRKANKTPAEQALVGVAVVEGGSVT